MARPQPTQGGAVSLDAFREAWTRLLESLKRDKGGALHAVLVEFRPMAVEGDNCVLAIASKFGFHQRQMELKKAEIASRLSALLQRPVRLEVRVNDGAVAPPASPARGDPRQEHESFVEETLNLFGGTIVND